MASVDRSQSISGASDEIFEHVCGPCNNGNIVIEGYHYCQNCAEYLCDSCRDHHERLSLTSSHTIILGGQLSSATRNDGLRLFIYCSCSRKQTAVIYCQDHKDVVCMTCKTLKHRKCKTETVQKRCEGYKSSKLDEVLDKIKVLKSEVDRLLITCKNDADDLLSMKKSCKKEISKFRKEMDTFLDRLEEILLQELDEHSEEQENNIDCLISSLTTASQMIDSDRKQLTDAKRDGRATAIFTADVQVTRNLTEYGNMLREAGKEYKKPQLAFERNNVLESIDVLGYITTCWNDGIETQMLLMNMEISSVRHVSVSDNDDENELWITGCTFMPNGYLVLCDFNNSNIKVLNSEWKCIDKLEAESSPWSLSAVGHDKVIVTLPNDKQLQYVLIFPQTKFETIVQLNKKCYGIVVSDNKIFVSCDANISEAGDVRILDLEGNQKQKFVLDQFGSLKYPEPDYLTVDSINKMIFVTNRQYPSSVACLTFDGSIVYQYTSSKLKGMTGIYVDAEDNAYVCDRNKNTVHIISYDGRHCGALIGPRDGLEVPYSIAVRESDGTLVIGCYNYDSIFLVQLS